MFPGYPSTSGSGKIVGTVLSGNATQDAERRGKIAAVWPGLLAAMTASGIRDTPARVAAFLTTLVFESLVQYDAVDGTFGTRPYPGCGLIQLTGEPNYIAASNYLGVDLTAPVADASHPARSLELSPRIAVWYWTVARPSCNAYADALRMGKVNAAIGYPLTGSNDADRCMVFRHALSILSGVDVPAGSIDCAR